MASEKLTDDERHFLLRTNEAEVTTLKAIRIIDDMEKRLAKALADRKQNAKDWAKERRARAAAEARCAELEGLHGITAEQKAVLDAVRDSETIDELAATLAELARREAKK